MLANFTPTQNEYKGLGQFRYWCQKVLPLAYDDSISYYELLGKIVNYLNETISNMELVGEDMTKVYNAINQMQSWLDNYFENLDVQDEINSKLDSMFADGSLSTLIERLVEEYKNELSVEVVTTRLRGQNSPSSPAGTFDSANFAGQGLTTGIPIGNVFHHYTDGKAIQIDNVGEGNVIVTMVNANNKTRRPDKADTFYGTGYYLQLMTNNQNTGEVYSHMVIDNNANPFWSGVKQNGSPQSVEFTNAKEYNYIPAFVFKTTREHGEIVRLKNVDKTVLIVGENTAVEALEIKSSSDMTGGITVAPEVGDIRIVPTVGRVVMNGTDVLVKISALNMATPTNVQPIIHGTSDVRPTIKTGMCGMCYFDRTLNKPIWVDKTESNWVDATGTVV